MDLTRRTAIISFVCSFSCRVLAHPGVSGCSLLCVLGAGYDICWAGRADQLALTGIDIFTGKKLEDSTPTSHNVQFVNVTRADYTVRDLDDD